MYLYPSNYLKHILILTSFTKFKTYLGARNIHWNETKFEENFNLKTPDGKYNLLANLLADENATSIKVAFLKVEINQIILREMSMASHVYYMLLSRLANIVFP